MLETWICEDVPPKQVPGGVLSGASENQEGQRKPGVLKKATEKDASQLVPIPVLNLFGPSRQVIR